MHSRCFTANPLDPGIAQEIAKTREIRVSRIFDFRYEYYVCNRCKEYAEKEFLPERAAHLQREGRHKDLAELYEAYGDMERASEERANAKDLHHEFHEPRERRGESEIELLLKELMAKNASVYLYCPSCSSSILITGDVRTEALNFCGHCGHAIDQKLVAEKIRGALGLMPTIDKG